MQSEMRHKFQNPVLKKPPVTRAKRLEQFLWREFYEEYIRSNEQSCANSSETPITEYIDEYCTFARQRMQNGEETEKATAILTQKFPLYSNAAITLWNPKGGESGCSFGKILSITLPIAEQKSQFG